MVTNRLGDVLTHTTGYELVVRGTGLLDSDAPDLTRYVFTDPRAQSFFADWDEDTRFASGRLDDCASWLSRTRSTPGDAPVAA